VQDQADGLTINYNHDYPGGVTLNGPVTVTEDITMLVKTETISLSRSASHPITESVNLGILLGRLKSQIASLEARVAALEAK
jgi:hypothetical protein